MKITRRHMLAAGTATAATLITPQTVSAATPRVRTTNARRKPPDPVAEAYTGPLNEGDVLRVRHAWVRDQWAYYVVTDVAGKGLRLYALGTVT